MHRIIQFVCVELSSNWTKGYKHIFHQERQTFRFGFINVSIFPSSHANIVDCIRQIRLELAQ